jgi:hypothetical protein
VLRASSYFCMRKYAPVKVRRLGLLNPPFIDEIHELDTILNPAFFINVSDVFFHRVGRYIECCPDFLVFEPFEQAYCDVLLSSGELVLVEIEVNRGSVDFPARIDAEERRDFFLHVDDVRLALLVLEPQDRLDFFREHVRVKWLGDIIDRAEGKPLYLVVHRGSRSKEYERNACVLRGFGQPVLELVAVHRVHHNIRNDDIRQGYPREFLDRLLPVQRIVYGITEREILMHEREKLPVVVDEQ